MRRVLEATGLILAVCVAVRVATWLVTPALPFIGGFLVLVVVLFLIFPGDRGRRFR